MIAYVGCGYYKEHIIPAFRRVTPFPRIFPFHFHSHLPINAVQFIILSIIAIGYKPAVAPYGSEVSSILLPISKTAIIDKTLFYEICSRNSVKLRIVLEHILASEKFIDLNRIVIVEAKHLAELARMFHRKIKKLMGVPNLSKWM